MAGGIWRIVFAAFLLAGLCAAAGADDQEDGQTLKLDMVSDTVAAVFNKANAILAGNLDVKLLQEKRAPAGEYTRNAIGQMVPTRSAINAAGSLHDDDPL